MILTWWSVHLNFSKDSHFIKCFLAACMTLRLLTTTSLVETPSNAGSLSFRKVDTLGFLPKTSWLGLNPWTLWSEFLIFIAHASAISKLQCMSSQILPFSQYPIMLFNSTHYSMDFLCTMIFKFCTMSQNYWLLNSLSLSLRIDPEVPKYVIQCLNIALMMSELSLLGILINQVKYFVAIDFFDIHGNIFVKIWS